jgi:hypothetical protein
VLYSKRDRGESVYSDVFNSAVNTVVLSVDWSTELRAWPTYSQSETNSLTLWLDAFPRKTGMCRAATDLVCVISDSRIN